MRLTAYKKIIDSACKLPENLYGQDYFKKIPLSLNPRMDAINKILEMARKDTDGLFNGEFVELYKYSDSQLFTRK